MSHIAHETAWPVPARLRKLALESTETGQMTAAEAWQELYANRHERRHAPRWSSEAVRRAAEAVGWADPNWLTEQIPTIRAQFERYYSSLQGKARDTAAIEVAQHLLTLSRDRRQNAQGPQRISLQVEQKP